MGHQYVAPTVSELQVFLEWSSDFLKLSIDGASGKSFNIVVWMGNIRYCLNIGIKKLFIIVIPYDCDIIQHSVFIYKVKNTFSQSVYHFWNYMVKTLKANIMAELIWSNILPSFLSPMTTAEGGNPSRWTGGMRRRLSYKERLLQCSLQGWLCKHEIYGHPTQV